MIMPMIMSMTSEFKCVSISNCDAFGVLLGAFGGSLGGFREAF